MTEERSVLREVAWQEVFPSVKLLSAWRVAFSLRTLVFAVVGIVATSLGWQLLDKLFDQPIEDSLVNAREVDFIPPANGSLRTEFSSGPIEWWQRSPLAAAWSDLVRPFSRLFDTSIGPKRFAYLLFGGIWSLAVWAFAGGAITRFAAVQLAREERLSWGQAIRYARIKWPSYFAAPLFPLFGVFLAAIPLAVLGLVMRAGGLGVAITGLLWPVALAGGVVMTVLALGLFFGFPLMWATISAEGTDSFDGLSRSYSYTIQRPLRYLGYLLLAAVLGSLAWLLVHLIAAAVLQLSEWAVSWGSGGDRLAEVLKGEGRTGLRGFGADVIGWWRGVVMLVATAFLYSYFWVASTYVYFLLRYHVDATELDEVYLPDEDDPHGLPPLTTDAAGVVQVADAPGGMTPENGSPEG